MKLSGNFQRMLRLDHVALPISDPSASYRFYSEVLGLKLVQALSGDDWGGKRWLMMIFCAPDGRQLALCALAGDRVEQRSDDARHYAFSVETAEEQDIWRQKLRAHAVEFTEEDHGAQKSIYFKDPSGVVLEITTPPSAPMVQNDPQQVVRNFLERS